jgi:phenol hydroxylase P5 protein
MAYELTIEPLGVTIGVEEGQNILDAALRNGIYLPHACCHGLCATCKVQMLDGDIEHGDASPFALMDFEREEGKALACCATLCSDATLEAELDEDPDAQVIPVRDLAGTIVRLEQLTPTVKGVFIQLDEPLPFQAGQYINLHIPGAGCTRAFSIASAGSDPSLIELNVRIVPGGVGTTYVHEKLFVGERVTISGPYGRFFVRKSAGVPLLFMAGGSGLSSPRAMIHELLREDCGLPITLVYGQRNRQELYYHDEFVDLARRYPNFTYVPALSDADADSGWDGYRGYVHDAAREHFRNDFRGHQAYLCGPPPMIEACLTALMQGQLYERDIYTEKFISAADAQQVRSPLFKRV